jgi:antitoxin component of MazEF toxin-antitoxin module
VSIPAALLRQVGLDVGSQVYFDLAEDEPGVIRVLPADHVKVSRR